MRGLATPVVGVEHEYRVLDGDAQVDFRTIVHELALDGLRLDPTDPNAYRCGWGGLVTADGLEAEVATPPITLRPGCTREVERATVFARGVLTDALPTSLTVDGYSTHVNVAVDDDEVVAAGRLFVHRYSPAMMMLLDRSTSPGLLVRPRSGRLELGGEYCAGEALRAATTFGAAASLACSEATRSRAMRQGLPRRVRARVRPATMRAGWYVDRRAFGPDLYSLGRGAALHIVRGGVVSAQSYLADAWERTRSTAEHWFDSDELLLVDRIVDGHAPLPMELDGVDAFGSDVDAVAGTPVDPFGRALQPRRRPRFAVEAVVVAWEAVVFRISGARVAFACVPRVDLDRFLTGLERGELDQRIESFLASPPSGRILADAGQATETAMFDDVAAPDAVVPPERVGSRPRPRGFDRGGGTPTDARREKHRQRRRRGFSRRALVVAGAIALVLLMAVAAVAIAGSGGGKEQAATAARGGTPVAHVPTTLRPTTTTIPPTTTTDPTGSLVGTYNVNRTISGGDEPAPFAIGAVDNVPFVITQDCSTSPCTLVVTRAAANVNWSARLTLAGGRYQGPLSGTSSCVSTDTGQPVGSEPSHGSVDLAFNGSGQFSGTENIMFDTGAGCSGTFLVYDMNGTRA